MRTEIALLQNVRVASPCDASWDAMASIDGDRVRFCAGCQKRGYNLSALGRAEGEGHLRRRVHSGTAFGGFFEKHSSPSIPSGKRWSVTGRSPRALSKGSPTATR